MHHLYGTASETEGHWPNGSLPTPIEDVVQTSDGPFSGAVLCLSKGRVVALG